MKNLMYALALLLTAIVTNNVKAQEVKLKSDKIIVDDKPTFDYDKDGFEFHIYKLNTKDEIVYIQHSNNSTISYLEDDYKKIIFPNNNVNIESALFRARSFKYIVTLLLTEKVLDLEGNIDAEKLQKFATKYNENITARTVRLN